MADWFERPESGLCAFFQTSPLESTRETLLWDDARMVRGSLSRLSCLIGLLEVTFFFRTKPLF